MIALQLISRLDGVRPTGRDQWIAKCPAHDDKSPSLSIRETSDGTILIKCWAGCSAYEIVSSVGLELSNLFPARIPQLGRKPERRPFPASDALRCMANDVIFLLICASDMQRGEKLIEPDIKNLVAIGARLRASCNYLGINP